MVITVMVEENERKGEEGSVNFFPHQKDLLIEDLFLVTEYR